MNATDRIESLALLRHPEGGWFRETYRAKATVDGHRAVSTAIYFLLESGEVSHLHRIDADEHWHHYEGSCLRIHVFDERGYSPLLLGPLSVPGATPQCWVSAGAWFGAEVVDTEGYALVGCTVAPGFEFSTFELAEADTLRAHWPKHRALIERMTLRTKD